MKRLMPCRLIGILVLSAAAVASAAPVADNDQEKLQPGKTPGTFHLIYHGTVGFTIKPEYPTIVSIKTTLPGTLAKTTVADGKPFTLEADLRPATYWILATPADDHAESEYWPMNAGQFFIDKDGNFSHQFGPNGKIVLVHRMSGFSPADLDIVDSDRPTLTWNPVSGAKAYSGEFYTKHCVAPFQTNAPQYKLPDSLPLEPCRWNVWAQDDKGQVIAHGFGKFLPHGFDPEAARQLRTQPAVCVPLRLPTSGGFLGIRSMGSSVTVAQTRPQIPLISSNSAWREIPCIVVEDVLPDSPAIQAGLRPDDMILSVNGEAVGAKEEEGIRIGDAYAFVDHVRAMQPGTVVTFTIRRDSKELKIPVTIVSAPSETRQASKPAPEPDVGPDQIAVRAVVVSFVRDLLNGDTKSAAGLCLAAAADDPDLNTLAAMCASDRKVGEEAVNRFGQKGRILQTEESSTLKVIKGATLDISGDTARTWGAAPPILLKRSGKEWKIDLANSRRQPMWQSVQRDGKAVRTVLDDMARDIKAGKFNSPEEAKKALKERIALATNRQAPER